MKLTFSIYVSVDCLNNTPTLPKDRRHLWFYFAQVPEKQLDGSPDDDGHCW